MDGRSGVDDLQTANLDANCDETAITDDRKKRGVGL